MATLYTHQSSNTQKTWALIVAFLVLIIGFGFILSQATGDPTILYIAIIFSLVMNVLSYWFSDKIALAVSGAHPVTREEYFDLWNTVENLSITAGLPMPKVYIINDEAPNAFATGRDKEHAVVAVTSGLLKILNKTELEGVIAHELAHIGNRDILLSSMVVVLVGFVTILADIFLRSHWLGRRDSGKEGNIQGIFFLAGIILSILSPIFATLMQLAISRKREFLADASGALLTRYPEGLASALEKISANSRPMVRANNATAHLFIANPFGGQKGSGPGFIAKLFMTHPPVEERVKVLRGN